LWAQPSAQHFLRLFATKLTQLRGTLATGRILAVHLLVVLALRIISEGGLHLIDLSEYELHPRDTE